MNDFNKQIMWWGTYGEGLWRMTTTAAGNIETEQALPLESPAFVLHHPVLPLLYAVSEVEKTIVSVIDVADPGNPIVVESVSTGGRHGCHLLLARNAAALYITHYSSGDIVVIPLGPKGLPQSDIPLQSFGHKGEGPRKDRQESPHAHFVGYAPGGNHLLVADLGTDELRSYECSADGSLSNPGIAATLPPGTGPRHFAVYGNHIYLVCELDHMLRTLEWDSTEAKATLVDTQPSTTVELRTGDCIYDGHIDVAGKVILVSVRGCNVISLFDIGRDDRISYRCSFDTEGVWPRHFAMDEERLIVGNEHSSDIRIFKMSDVLNIGAEDFPGEIQKLSHAAAVVKSPACIVL